MEGERGRGNLIEVAWLLVRLGSMVSSGCGSSIDHRSSTSFAANEKPSSSVVLQTESNVRFQVDKRRKWQHQRMIEVECSPTDSVPRKEVGSKYY